jgi:hypothetical protein
MQHLLYAFTRIFQALLMQSERGQASISCASKLVGLLTAKPYFEDVIEEYESSDEGTSW